MKGLSPLIAVVLLIAIAVAVSSLIMTWISSVTTDQQVTVSNRSTGITECGGHSIRIEDVYLDFVANKSRVTVRNTGQVEGRVISANLQNKQGVSALLNTTLPFAISQGELKTIEFALNNTISACANFSQARVTTQCVTDSFKKTPTNC